MEELPVLTASPELEKFFNNLLNLKEYILRKSEKTNSEDLKEIYEKLHAIIKEKKE